MTRPGLFLALGLMGLTLATGPALAHAFSDKTILLSYGGTMQRCGGAQGCVTLPFQTTSDTIYLTDDKVFDYGRDKASNGVELNQRHEESASGHGMAVTYGVVGQRFITEYDFQDESGGILSSVAIIVTAHGTSCSVEYQQKQPGYRFSPRLALRRCSIAPGRVGG